MNHFEAVVPPTHFAFNSQVPNSTPKSQSFDHMASDSGSSNMPIYDDYGDSDGNGHFNDVLPGIGNKVRPKPESRWSVGSIGKTNKSSEDYNAMFTTTSPHVASSGSRKANGTSVSTDGAKAYDDLDPFGSLGKPTSSFSSLKTDTGKEGSPMRTQGTSEHPTYSSKEIAERFSGRSPGEHSGRKLPVEDNHGSPRSFFKMPSVFTSSRKSFRQAASSRKSSQVKSSEKSAHVDTPPWSQKIVKSSDDVWLTVSEVPLFTQPTRAPPPSRPAPPPPVLSSRGSSAGSSSATKIHEFSSFKDLNGCSGDCNSVPTAARSSTASRVDESGRVAMGWSRSTANDFSCDEVGVQPYRAASAATMKGAMDRAETKFEHAKGMRESKQDVEEKNPFREQERLEQGQLQKEKEEGEHWKLEKERERKEKENEQRRLEKERERARQAVERATREARERAAAEARLKAEKASLEKANAEARRLAERAAVQRAQAEARERAAALAKERAEKAAAEARRQEAREKAFEAQMKAERGAVERAAAEAQEKAATEAWQKMAAAAKAPNFSSKQSTELAKASAATASRLREASAAASFVEDLSCVFNGAALAGDIQEFEGESEERRRVRLERHQRTQERAARALAEKNERDLQIQREQEERQRIAETLDTEIKRWAAGKEGNLRVLLATLHYVLWPECGWQPVSLTDLMTGASVKKVYRKATLCIHPDKVQQKGANLQQKYIAEKVFDLLKEAWNKFNSEELF